MTGVPAGSYSAKRNLSLAPALYSSIDVHVDDPAGWVGYQRNVLGDVEFRFRRTDVQVPLREHLILRKDLVCGLAKLLGRFRCVEHFGKALKERPDQPADSWAIFRTICGEYAPYSPQSGKRRRDRGALGRVPNTLHLWAGSQHESTSKGRPHPPNKGYANFAWPVGATRPKCRELAAVRRGATEKWLKHSCGCGKSK